MIDENRLPDAQEHSEVCLTGWREGALAVSAILVIHQHSSVGLAQAKRVVEACLAKQSAVVIVPGEAEAKTLVHFLISAGFNAQVRNDA